MKSAASDPRIEIRLRDGRRELLRNPARYDLIILEPPPPSAARVVNLYSTDFYALAAARLRPGGLLAQWLPLPTQNDEDTRTFVASFLEVFPHATLWSTEPMVGIRQRTIATILSALLALVALEIQAQGKGASADPLPSWNDTGPKKAIVTFVEQVTKKGSLDFVSPPERIATSGGKDLGSLPAREIAPIEDKRLHLMLTGHRIVRLT